jgi:hypothetical protein
MDYKYDKLIIDVEDLILEVEKYQSRLVIQSKTENNMAIYYGNPVITINVLLESLQNCQIINLVIQEVCYGVNKLLFELYKEILKKFGLSNIASFNNYENKADFEANIKKIDKVFFVGNHNLYSILRRTDKTKLEYIPFENIDIYCEDEQYDDFANEIFNYAIKYGYEAEVFDEMEIDSAIEYFNQYGNKFCALILTSNKEHMEKFKNELDYQYVFANENPFAIKKTFKSLYSNK